MLSPCSLCHDLQPKNQSEALDFTIEFLKLRQRDHDCKYCTLLLAAVKQLDKDDRRTTKTFVHIEAGKPIVLSTNSSRSIQSFETWYMLYRPHGRQNYSSTQRGAHVVFIGVEVPSFPQLGEEQNLQDDLGSQANIQFIQSCLRSCRENKSDMHLACSRSMASGSTPIMALPSRLIRIDGEALRLVETAGGMTASYCALSYQWGPLGSFNFKTLTQNHAQLKQGFHLCNLPILLQHAIQVTSELGFQFLWIDAICIIQDNHDGASINIISSPAYIETDFLEDWEQEAAKMGQYYQNAELTISAASALDVNSPMLGARKPIEVVRSSFYEKEYCNPYEYEIVCDGGSISKVIGRQFPKRGSLNLTNDEPLATRAWTCQENVLSRRVIHFTASEVIWECRSQQCFETGASLQSSIGLSYNFAHSHHDMERYWKTLLMDYSNRILTYEQDRLPAIRGLATEVATLTGTQFLAGLFRGWLHSDLLWSSNFRQRDTSNPPLAKLNASLPTWSWVSITCGVGYDLDHCQDSPKHSAIKFCDIKFTPEAPENPFGGASEACLTVEGRVFPASLVCTKNTEAYKYELSWPGSNGWFSPDCMLGFVPATDHNGRCAVQRLTKVPSSESDQSFEAQVHALYVGGGRYPSTPSIDDVHDLDKSRIPSWLSSRVPWYNFAHYYLILADMTSRGQRDRTFVRIGLFKSLVNKGPPQSAKKMVIRLV